MVPAVSLTKMPLTANGKIDHQALPAPDRVRPNQAAFYTPPRTDVEQQMVRAWQEVLNLDKVGIHDNFFDLGGNSLLLLRAYNRLEHLFNHDEMGIEFFKYRRSRRWRIISETTKPQSNPTTARFKPASAISGQPSAGKPCEAKHSVDKGLLGDDF